MNKNYTFLARLLAGSVVVGVLGGCNVINSVKNKLGSDKTKTASTESASSENVSPVAESTCLLKINGEVELTKGEFDIYANQLLQSNQYFKNVGLDALPAPVKRKIFDRIVEQRLIVKKAKSLRYQDKEEFKKSFNQSIKLVENLLLSQLYEKEILDSITVTQEEIKKEFDVNQDKYVKVAGGSLVEGVRFTNDADATRFYDKVKASPQKFASLAKAEKKAEYKDFGRVSKDPRSLMMSGITPAVLDAALNAKNIPGVLKADDGSNKWVIYVSDKKDSIYFDYEEIKPQLEMLVKRNKFMTTLEERVKALKSEYTLDVKEEFFATSPQEQEAEKDDKAVARISAEQLEKSIKKTEKA